MKLNLVSSVFLKTSEKKDRLSNILERLSMTFGTSSTLGWYTVHISLFIILKTLFNVDLPLGQPSKKKIKIQG